MEKTFMYNITTKYPNYYSFQVKNANNLIYITAICKDDGERYVVHTCTPEQLHW